MKKFIFTTLIISSILFLLVLPLGQDMWYHMYRIGAMAEELQLAPFRLPIRMLSSTYNEYGYGAALYYGDLFLYPFAFLAMLGADIVWIYKFLVVSIWWSTFGMAYFSIRRLGEKSEKCMLFAYVYTFSSCCTLNLCVRSAIGESLAMIFLPLIFYSFYGLLHKEGRKDWFWLALGMSAVALSHMITLMWCVIILGIWAFWEWKIVFFRKKWMEIIKAIFMMLGLSASFVFPMLEQMLFQKVQTPTNSGYQKQGFMDYGIEWIDYFIPYEVKKALTGLLDRDWNIEFWHPGTIGLFALFLIICALYLKKRNRLELSAKKKLVFLISIAALAALGIAPLMNFAKEVFSFMQFSWRILPFITLGLATTTIELTLFGDLQEVRQMVRVLLIGCFLIFGLAVGPRYVYQIYVQANDYQYIRENNPEFFHKYHYAYDPNAANCLYLPEGVWGGFYLERGETVEAVEKGREKLEFSWERKEGEIIVDLTENPYDEVTLELPLFMYKGYAATLSNEERLEVVKTENGLVGISAGRIIGEVKVKYDGTLCQKLSDWITFISLLSIMVIFRCRKADFIL